MLKRTFGTIELGAAGPPTDDDLKLIRKYTLRAFAPEELAVRSMLIVNDQPDDTGAFFTPKALDQVKKLVPGKPMSKEHARIPPIARMFRTERVTIAGWEWVRGWAYWPTITEEGAAMTANVDSGLWNEVSLAWWIEKSTCTICNKPLGRGGYWPRECEHIPGQDYGNETCLVKMTDVADVLEVSIVLKGSFQKTRIMAARSSEDRDLEVASLDELIARRISNAARDTVIDAGQTPLEQLLEEESAAPPEADPFACWLEEQDTPGEVAS